MVQMSRTLTDVAARLETAVTRMEAAVRRECDCSLADLRRENERLLTLLHRDASDRPCGAAPACGQPPVNAR